MRWLAIVRWSLDDCGGDGDRMDRWQKGSLYSALVVKASMCPGHRYGNA